MHIRQNREIIRKHMPNYNCRSCSYDFDIYFTNRERERETAVILHSTQRVYAIRSLYNSCEQSRRRASVTKVVIQKAPRLVFQNSGGAYNIMNGEICEVGNVYGRE